MYKNLVMPFFFFDYGLYLYKLNHAFVDYILLLLLIPFLKLSWNTYIKHLKALKYIKFIKQKTLAILDLARIRF